LRVAAESPGRLVQRVARRISELRRDAGLTQEKLAERLNVTVQYVSRIEVGENLTLHSLAVIARALEVKVSELFEPAAALPRTVKRGRPRKSSG
jgi:transcriptional regulator with XRE-family HTH domain